MQPSKWRLGARLGSILLITVFTLLLAGNALALDPITVLISVLEDGTSPFEDWTPGQTANAVPTSPIPDGIQQPGDDLNANNGYVRTGDVVIFQGSFNVNQPPQNNVVVTFSLGGTATGVTFDIDDLPLDVCDGNLSTISGDGRTLTCVVGNVPGPNSETFTFNIPAYVPASALNGQTITADMTVTSATESPPVSTSGSTEVSAAPRSDLRKVQAGKAVNKRGGVYGYDTFWDISVIAGDTDSRGNSQPALPITYTDEYSWQTNGASTQTYLVSPMPACSQGGGPGTTVSCSFNDLNTHRLTFFTPLTELEGFDATPDSGSDTLINDVALDGNGDSTWDPNDNAGVSNWGTGTENPTNNTDDQLLGLSTGRGVNKVFDPRNSSSPARVVDGTLIKANLTYNTGTNTKELTNPIMCDKFDNSRFALRDIGGGQAATVSVGSNVPAPTYVIEYGANSGWGAPSAATDSAEWYLQHTTNCADASATSGWFTGAQVDWTNSGGASIDAEDVNMVRVRFTGILQPTSANTLSMTVNWTVLDNDNGEWLINASSFYDETNAAWLNSTCYGVSGTNCPNPPTLGSSQRPGDRADEYLHVEAPVSIRKQVCDPSDPIDCTYDSVLGAPGNIVPFKLYPQVGNLSWNNNEPVWPTPGATALAVVVTDVLPKNLDYVANSAFVDGVPTEPTVTPNTPLPGQTTLTWNLGDVVDGKTIEIVFNARVSAFAPNNTQLVNNTTVSSPSDASPSNLHRDSAEIGIRSSAKAGIDKLTLTPIVETNQPIAYELSYGNLSSDHVQYTDFVDILPYNGDPNGSVFTGQLDLVNVTGPVAKPGANGTPNPIQIWISAVPGATLDLADGTLDGFQEPVAAYGSFSGGLGGPDWPCQIASAGVGPCPALTAVTAIRIIGLDPNGGTGAGNDFLAAFEGPHALTLNLSATGNQKGDLYNNTWGGRFEGLPLPVWSPDKAEVRVFNGVIGDFVWFDANNNGKFDAGDYNAGPGITVNLLDGSGNFITSTVTDANGRYIFTDLDEGEYIVEIPASNFAENAPLEATTIANGAEAPGPYTGPENEDVDHNGTNPVAGGVRSNVIKLTPGGQPLNDIHPDTPPFQGADEDSNLTIDFAFVPPPRDHGDLPDTGAGTGSGNYQTTNADNGPSHIIVSGVQLGPVAPDQETDGQPNSSASGDNINGTNDEDGVVFLTPMAPGTTAKVRVTTNDTDGTGFLSLYFDFNGDGDFDDPGETFLADAAQSNGVHTFDVPVPANAAKIFGVRARFTDEEGQGGASPTGPGSRGEIEDYMLGGLGDFVWFDTNGNGLQDIGEPGLPGYRVNLLKPNGTPVLDANGDPITTVTDANGYYEFVGLPPGDYRVEFVVIGRDITTQNADSQGLDGPKNSDPDVTTGITPVISLPGGFNPNIDAGLGELNFDTACVSGSNELTTILGSGMGNNISGQKTRQIVIPNYTAVTGLYAQFAGKDNGQTPKRVRFWTNVQPRIDMLGGPTHWAYQQFAVYLYTQQLDPARYVKVRVWDSKLVRLKTPRALFVYATHQTQEEYSNVVQYNEESIENEVYWDTSWGWIPTQTMTVALEPNYVPVDLNVQIALTENDNDERPLVVRVHVDGAADQEFVLYRENINDMASILRLTVQDIPVATEEMTITLHSPAPFDPVYQTGERGGDSGAILGAAASFECTLP